MKGNTAILLDSSPFRAVFAYGVVPIVNCLVPSRVELEGCEEKAYMVDLQRCTAEQLLQIADILAAQAGPGCNPSIILPEIMRVGLPVRASQVRAVSTDSLFFL